MCQLDVEETDSEASILTRSVDVDVANPVFVESTQDPGLAVEVVEDVENHTLETRLVQLSTLTAELVEPEDIMHECA